MAFAVVLCQGLSSRAPACFGVNPRERGASLCFDRRCGPSKKWCRDAYTGYLQLWASLPSVWVLGSNEPLIVQPNSDKSNGRDLI